MPALQNQQAGEPLQFHNAFILCSDGGGQREQARLEEGCEPQGSSQPS